MKDGVIKSVKRLLNTNRVPSLLFVLLVAGSCADKDRLPDGIMTREEMVSVLSELYLSEQKINAIGVKRDSLRQIFSEVEPELFERAGTTDSLFKRSMNYYLDRPRLMEGLYTSLIDSLNLKEQRMISRESKK
jgi:Domain of unknown function (DUF4296)